ncbi:MAG: Gfo/Idh/MocA family oxidoreductase [Armatimonadota bacterium]|nr:Gfo/Idh/MocA family oxidoreductase [Armatimonadota bacterium]
MVGERKIKCAVVGYGGAFNMGKAHAQWMNDTGRMITVAACDINPERMEAAKRDFPNIQTYTDIDDMLRESDAELVVIVTPHNTHADLGLKAIEAGKHVVLEKPMCLTVEEATKMIEAAKKAGVTLTTFHNRRHDGDFMMIKEIIEKGLIGEVFHIEAFIGGYNKPGSWWRSDKEISGGCLYDWGAHFVDWILNLIPEKIENVTGFFHKRVWHDVTNEDQTQAIIRFRNGAMADLQVSNIARLPKPKFRILGTKGAIIDEWKGTLRLSTEIEGIPIDTEVKYKDSTWHEYYPNLAAHLLDGAPLEVTPESSRRVIAVIETAEKSAKSGKAEPVPYE